jgi:hypothetical protein
MSSATQAARLMLLAGWLLVFDLSSLAFAQQPPDPIIVDISKPPESEMRGLADVLIGALGLTGLLMLGAILAAGVFAGVLFWIRSRAE